MSLTAGNFQFGDFVLDADEKILLHKGTAVSLSPKALKLLLILVEKRGRIVEKDDLMEQIWPDTYVENGNLAYTVKLLRKALGDDTNNPVYIETIPRRGYKFIAEVTEITRPEIEAQAAEPAADRLKRSIQARRRRSRSSYVVSIVAVMLLCAVGLGSWYASSNSVRVPVLSEPFEAKRLSGDGKTMHAAMAPDGSAIAYAIKIGNEQQSVRLRQLATGNDVEVLPPSNDIYTGLDFSPDGNFLYLARGARGPDPQANIYRVPVVGGIPEIVIRETHGWFSISPDGSLISFARGRYERGKGWSLLIANTADGKNERVLATRSSPLWISDNAFSPLGSSVAFVAGHALNEAREMHVYEVDIASGKERVITQTGFFSVKSIAWLPNAAGLLMTAAPNSGSHLSIWRADPKSGEAIELTSDSQNYSRLSIDDKGQLIAATQAVPEYQLLKASIDSNAVTPLPTSAVHAQFGSDGSIVFSTMKSGNAEIWRMNSDGSLPRQLTRDPSQNNQPVVSRDSASIYFSSNRSGSVQVWRMNSDGSDQRQLTKAEGGYPVFVSADDEWIYYKNGTSRTLWRVRSNGSDEQMALDRTSEVFSVSPDGTTAAVAGKLDGKPSIDLVALNSGRTIKAFALLPSAELIAQLAWTPDGEMVSYIAADGSGENTLYLQPVNGDPLITSAALGNGGYPSLAVAPGSRDLLVSRRVWRYDAVLVTGLKR